MTSPREPVSAGMYYPDAQEAQLPADVSVVIPTVLRPALLDALDSIFAQTFSGRMQILVGVDVAKGAAEALRAKLEQRPEHVSAIVLTLPHSTSTRNGGLHLARDGGVTRTVLSYIANSRHVAYLDDDNCWEPDHVATLFDAIQGRAWAASNRTLIDDVTNKPVCVDKWDSVGANRGRFAGSGGLVDPSCLMVDKLAVSYALYRWTEPMSGSGSGADRSFFQSIAQLPHSYIDKATVRYRMRRTNIMWKFHKEQTVF